MILRRYLHNLKNQQIDTLILGCTHYPLLKPLIQARIGRNVKLIDSSAATALFLKNALIKDMVCKPLQGHQPDHNRFFVTDLTATSAAIADKIFGRTVELLPV